MKTFWTYCQQVKDEFVGDNLLRADRLIIQDIETVATCFDADWSPRETADTLLDRFDLLPARSLDKLLKG